MFYFWCSWLIFGAAGLQISENVLQNMLIEYNFNMCGNFQKSEDFAGIRRIFFTFFVGSISPRLLPYVHKLLFKFITFLPYQVYIEDALGERLWVDHPDCKSFVDNILTAFNTKSSQVTSANVFYPAGAKTGKFIYLLVQFKK